MPFTVGATGVGPKMSATRLAESLIIACITGVVAILGALYVAQPVTDTKLLHMAEQVREMRADMKEMQVLIVKLGTQIEVMKQREPKE